MATVKKMMKAQDGYMTKIKKSAASDTSTKKGMNFDKKSFDSLPKLDDKILKKGENPYKSKMQNGGSKSKGFPDLNKDGKITKADILKGRGVIAKNGMKMGGKAKSGAKMKRGC